MLFSRDGPGAGYEQLVVVQQEALGLRAIVAIHSTARGPAFGGIRRHRYPSEEAALADVLGLAETMSRKCALAGLPAGGGKAVLLDEGSPAARRPELYAALGRAIDRLGGRFVCGPDVGTGEVELGYVRAVTRYCNPASNDASTSTAAGVLAALRAVWPVLGVREPRGCHVVVQGLGAVGMRVASRLIAQGVRVTGADTSPKACVEARENGVEVVEPDQALRTECDVLVPCALGGIVGPAVARQLPCRALCGSANNQLTGEDAAAILHDRGVVVVPDVVASAGAVIEGVLTFVRGDTPKVRAEVESTIAAIERTTADILAAAKRASRPPSLVARDRALSLLAAR
jgi:leucine dehydrogenase